MLWIWHPNSIFFFPQIQMKFQELQLESKGFSLWAWLVCSFKGSCSFQPFDHLLIDLMLRICCGGSNQPVEIQFLRSEAIKQLEKGILKSKLLFNLAGVCLPDHLQQSLSPLVLV